jgi:hypothetical protein
MRVGYWRKSATLAVFEYETVSLFKSAKMSETFLKFCQFGRDSGDFTFDLESFSAESFGAWGSRR